MILTLYCLVNVMLLRIIDMTFNAFRLILNL